MKNVSVCPQDPPSPRALSSGGARTTLCHESISAGTPIRGRHTTNATKHLPDSHGKGLHVPSGPVGGAVRGTFYVRRVTLQVTVFKQAKHKTFYLAKL